MYVRSMSIQNLRSFESVELPLCHPGDGTEQKAGSVPYLDNVTLLLGSNGAGKTSVLRAVALSSLAPVLAMGSGYVPYALVRRVKGRPAGAARVTSRVLLHAQDGLKEGDEEDMTATLMAPPRGYTDRFVIEKQPPSWHVRLYDEESPAFLVLGYGATRRVETGPVSVEGSAKERILRYRRVAGLFEEHVTLMPMAAWLPQVLRKNKKRHQEIVALLNKLLPDTKMLGTKEESEEPEILFQRAGSVLPYPALSDGYRAFIAWIGDVLYHLNMICPKGGRLVDMRGVVLVDEVDLHLHPEWQRNLVPSLSSVLPNLQFVLTSHSPLVVGTLSSRNVRLLEEREQTGGVRATEVVEPEEELYGLSSDQILTSESFGLESTRDERFFDRLKDAADKARDGGAEEALRFMRMVAGGGAAEEAPVYPKDEQKMWVLKGHESLVSEVAWAPSGRRLASSSADCTVRIWDTKTGRELSVLRGHEDRIVHSVAWAPSERRLAIAPNDATVRIWEAATGRELFVLHGHNQAVSSVAWEPSGRRLASASLDHTVRVWDAETGDELFVLRGHGTAVISVAWEPSGHRLASSSSDETVRIWDAETGRQLSVLRGHKSTVGSVAWDPSGRRLASSSADYTVRIWDTETSRELSVLHGHEDSVYSVAWDPAGRRLASASYDTTVRVWDVETGRELSVLRGHENKVYSVAWDPAGRRLASASTDKTVRIWEIDSTQPLLGSQTQKSTRLARSVATTPTLTKKTASQSAKKRAGTRKTVSRKRAGRD